MKQVLTADDAPNAPFLSQGIEARGVDTIYVSGQVHALPDNTLVGETADEKVAQIMKNVEAILKAANTSLQERREGSHLRYRYVGHARPQQGVSNVFQRTISGAGSRMRTGAATWR